MMFTHKFDKYGGAVYVRNDEYSTSDTNRLLLLFNGDTSNAPELIVVNDMGLRIFWKEYIM